MTPLDGTAVLSFVFLIRFQGQRNARSPGNDPRCSSTYGSLSISLSLSLSLFPCSGRGEGSYEFLNAEPIFRVLKKETRIE